MLAAIGFAAPMGLYSAWPLGRLFGQVFDRRAVIATQVRSCATAFLSSLFRILFTDF